MGWVKEFKEFALKGNMIDMAVGIVIGAAFGTVIKSLVSDVITPPLALLTEQVDFERMGPVLRAATEDSDEIRINFGSFLNELLSFVIIAVAIFAVIKVMNRVRAQFAEEEQQPSPTKKPCEFCKMEIPVDATRCG
ncbi:MAG: large conductance mechanosensitive channel protein MscL, partial [Rubripirellula sp.]